MSSDIARTEDGIKEFEDSLEVVNLQLQAEPSDELQALKEEIMAGIAEMKALLAELKPPSPPPDALSAHSTEKPKWSKENHPKYPEFRKAGQKHSSAEEVQKPKEFAPNDNVLAKWKDQKFYAAKILSMQGPPSNRTYYVNFVDYSETATVRELKPVYADSKKRKADDSPVPPTPPPQPDNSSVISAAANINPALATQVKKEPSKVSDGPPRPAKVARKVKPNKEYEGRKASWQDFSKKNPAKTTQSQFRTGAGPNARGYVNSGHDMRKDAMRTRHIHTKADDDEL